MPNRKLSRLGQWDGRRRSTRGDEPVLRRLCQRWALARLVPVLVTTALATFLACWWGPPFPYRIGEVYPRDLRVRVYFEMLNEPRTDRARDEAVERLPDEEVRDPVA